MLLFFACASNVVFHQTDETYEPTEKAGTDKILFEQNLIQRPHKVIGIIEAHLGKDSRRPQLDALIREKAREIGADGVMKIEYDVDRDTYFTTHNKVVGRGKHRHHVVGKQKHISIDKSATAIAVIFTD